MKNKWIKERTKHPTLTEQEELLLFRNGWRFMKDDYIFSPYEERGDIKGMNNIRQELDCLKQLPASTEPFFSKVYRGKSGRLNEITDETIMLQTMSQAINQWLHHKGDDVSRYVNYMDRVCDIQEVLSNALRESEKIVIGLKNPEGEDEI